MPKLSKSKSRCECGNEMPPRSNTHAAKNGCARCDALTNRRDMVRMTTGTRQSLETIPATTMIEIRRACREYWKRQGIKEPTGEW